MAEHQPHAPQTVVDQEVDGLGLRWIEARARLYAIWAEVPAIPSRTSRRAWAEAHGLDPIRVHQWFYYRQQQRGFRHHPQDWYELPVVEAREEQPPLPTSLDPATPSENPGVESAAPTSTVEDIAEYQPHAPQTVQEEEVEEDARWVAARALLNAMWARTPALPSLEARRAWAAARAADQF